MNCRLLTTTLTLCLAIAAMAQKKLWTLEAESQQTKLSWEGTEADIISPKGTTLWYKEKMKGDVVIEYDARVVVDDNNAEEWNRLSDLNCFWMASDPLADDVFDNIHQRAGKFVNSYTLQLYYVGFGGNHNSTTRFRRYNADSRAVSQEKLRPAVIKEFTDADHLLKPNHWYHIRLESIAGRVRYFIDGECLVDWLDPQPLRTGWFGFRTTLSHTQLRNFQWKQLSDVGKPVELRWIGADSIVRQPMPSAFGIPFDILKKRTEAGGYNRAFVLDACRSDFITGTRGGDETTRDLRPIGELVKDAPTKSSLAVLRSCSKYEHALEIESRKHGLFTLAMMDVLRSSKEAGTELLFGESLCDAVTKKMVYIARAEGIAAAQTPEFAKSGIAQVLINGRKVPPSASPSGTPTLVVCPVCGKKNHPENTFECRECKRKDLCLRHFEKSKNCCSDCAARKKEQEAVAGCLFKLVIWMVLGLVIGLVGWGLFQLGKAIWRMFS